MSGVGDSCVKLCVVYVNFDRKNIVLWCKFKKFELLNVLRFGCERVEIFIFKIVWYLKEFIILIYDVILLINYMFCVDFYMFCG